MNWDSQDIRQEVSMSSRTKIIVLHMKEIIYTVVFALLAIVLILLLVFMFRPGRDSSHKEEEMCIRDSLSTC